VGRPIAEFGVGPADPALLERITVGMRADGVWNGTFDVRRKDGSTFPAYVRCARLYDQRGEPDGMVAVSSDLTDRVRVERALREMHDYMVAVTDVIVEGVCTVDRAGRITFANAAAEHLLGHARSALLGMRADVLTASGRLDLTAARAEDEFVRADGSSFNVTYTATRFATRSGVRGIAVVFRDVTERRAREREEEQRLERMAWVGRIRDALDHDRLVLYTQPIVDLADGRQVQQELLIRMVSPDGDIVPPGRFLPAAEEYGLIGEIDRWVVSRAVERAALGQPVEFNLSAQSVGDRALPVHLEEELRRAGADPSLLVVEVTETGLIADEPQAANLARRLATLGCKLALDDFGTGFGSFTYLKHLHVDCLKIDVDFVRDLRGNASSRHVVRSVVDLARRFGLQTVAEGVEDQETLDLVRELGVDLAQGYFIGRPALLDEGPGSPVTPAGR
jgi:PAS domain S-box-containing protein